MPVGRLQRVLLSRSVAGCRRRTGRTGCLPHSSVGIWMTVPPAVRGVLPTVFCPSRSFPFFHTRFSMRIARVCSRVARLPASVVGSRGLFRERAGAAFFLHAPGGNFVSGVRFGFATVRRGRDATKCGRRDTFYLPEWNRLGASPRFRNDVPGRVVPKTIRRSIAEYAKRVREKRRKRFCCFSRTRCFFVARPLQEEGRRFVSAMRAFLRCSDFEALCRVTVLCPGHKSSPRPGGTILRTRGRYSSRRGSASMP